jgi:hypothetical protein
MHEHSNYILLKIPIEIHLVQRGAGAICIDLGRLLEALGVSNEEIEGLRKAGLICFMTEKPLMVQPVLRETYGQMLLHSGFARSAGLARHGIRWKLQFIPAFELG